MYTFWISPGLFYTTLAFSPLGIVGLYQAPVLGTALNPRVEGNSFSIWYFCILFEMNLKPCIVWVPSFCSQSDFNPTGPSVTPGLKCAGPHGHGGVPRSLGH